MLINLQKKVDNKRSDNFDDVTLTWQQSWWNKPVSALLQVLWRFVWFYFDYKDILEIVKQLSDIKTKQNTCVRCFPTKSDRNINKQAIDTELDIEVGLKILKKEYYLEKVQCILKKLITK